MSLDGRTPAESCGIEIKGQDKWKTLIQNVSDYLHSSQTNVLLLDVNPILIRYSTLCDNSKCSLQFEQGICMK